MIDILEIKTQETMKVFKGDKMIDILEIKTQETIQKCVWNKRFHLVIEKPIDFFDKIDLRMAFYFAVTDGRLGTWSEAEVGENDRLTVYLLYGSKVIVRAGAQDRPSDDEVYKVFKFYTTEDMSEPVIENGTTIINASYTTFAETKILSNL